MADPNDIRLNPLNRNEILRIHDLNSIWLLDDPGLPLGWEPNPGSKVVGGQDATKKVGSSGGIFGTPDEPSGNA